MFIKQLIWVTSILYCMSLGKTTEQNAKQELQVLKETAKETIPVVTKELKVAPLTEVKKETEKALNKVSAPEATLVKASAAEPKKEESVKVLKTDTKLKAINAAEVKKETELKVVNPPEVKKETELKVMATQEIKKETELSKVSPVATPEVKKETELSKVSPVATPEVKKETELSKVSPVATPEVKKKTELKVNTPELKKEDSNLKIPDLKVSVKPQKPLIKLFDYYNAHTESNCTLSNCGPRNGFCIDEHTCQCHVGYANFKPVTRTYAQEPERYCTYEQGSQLVAFLLEFFFPIGVGHLYAGRIVNGIIKMCFNIILPCVLCCVVAGCAVGTQSSI